jgi:formamidopyrimidine-DNA glycosylase
MPELPEVETIARDLEGVLTGQSVVEARFIDRSIKEQCNRFKPSRLAGHSLAGISRRGKNLIFHFSDNYAMVCHLKMTGRLIIDANSEYDKKHLHFEMKFNRSHLSFYDVRKFGRICITNEKGLLNHPRLSKLGPEPFEIEPGDFVNRVKSRHKAIKLILMDQGIIAGLGNIYADEALFDAGIRPTLKPYRISRSRLLRLHGSIIKVLHTAIKNRGTSVDDYLDGHGRQGNFQNLIKVYGKTGQPCPNCGHPVKRVVLGGRSTHYCTICQN